MRCTHTILSHKSAIHRQITILLTNFKYAKTWCNIQKTQLRPCFLFHSVFPWSITSVPSTACLQLQLKNTQWTPQSCAALSFCPTIVGFSPCMWLLNSKYSDSGLGLLHFYFLQMKWSMKCSPRGNHLFGSIMVIVFKVHLVRNNITL